MVTANLAPRSNRYNGAAAVAYDDDADDGDGAAPCLPCTYSQSRTQLLDLYLIFSGTSYSAELRYHLHTRYLAPNLIDLLLQSM